MPVGDLERLLPSQDQQRRIKVNNKWIGNPIGCLYRKRGPERPSNCVSESKRYISA